MALRGNNDVWGGGSKLQYRWIPKIQIIKHVKVRKAGALIPTVKHRVKLTDTFRDKIEGLIKATSGGVRADKRVHEA